MEFARAIPEYRSKWSLDSLPSCVISVITLNDDEKYCFLLLANILTVRLILILLCFHFIDQMEVEIHSTMEHFFMETRPSRVCIDCTFEKNVPLLPCAPFVTYIDDLLNKRLNQISRHVVIEIRTTYTYPHLEFPKHISPIFKYVSRYHNTSLLIVALLHLIHFFFGNFCFLFQIWTCFSHCCGGRLKHHQHSTQTKCSRFFFWFRNLQIFSFCILSYVF